MKIKFGSVSKRWKWKRTRIPCAQFLCEWYRRCFIFFFLSSSLIFGILVRCGSLLLSFRYSAVVQVLKSKRWRTKTDVINQFFRQRYNSAGSDVFFFLFLLTIYWFYIEMIANKLLYYVQSKCVLAMYGQPKSVCLCVLFC